MIVIRVELWSAVNGQVSELARMTIDNIGGTTNLGDYRVRTLRGRSREALDKALLASSIQREAKVLNHPRLREHVWNLVAKALATLGYGPAAPPVLEIKPVELDPNVLDQIQKDCHDRTAQQSLAALSPPIQEAVAGERERVAAIIDPAAVKCRDKVLNGVEAWDEKHGFRFEYWKNSWNICHKFNWDRALAKADAILSAIRSTTERG